MYSFDWMWQKDILFLFKIHKYNNMSLFLLGDNCAIVTVNSFSEPPIALLLHGSILWGSEQI